MIMGGDLEGTARWFHEETGIDSPVDAFDVADALDLRIEHIHGTGGRWEPGRVVLGRSTPARKTHSVLVHECAHELLHRVRTVNDERSARYLAAAILVPRRALDRQLRAGWDLHRLMAFHTNASAELLARRITDVRSAHLAVYDHGRLRYRVGPAKPLATELALVAQALSTSAPVRVDDCSGAWPVFDGQWRRVLVLAS